jgi:ligand-binding SRPBCC domain-containing protein
MPRIELETIIHAPRERVFNISRSIDFHTTSMKHTGEIAIAGRTRGLIELHETVTWQARHFGAMHHLQVQITAFDYPSSFTDEMVKGIFRSMKHTHTFLQQQENTCMKDVFDYTSPLGPIGKIADVVFLKQYMTRLLIRRNTALKAAAEGED